MSEGTWKFHTYINPLTIENIQKIAFNNSFEIFLNEILSNTEEILKGIDRLKATTNRTRYRFYINVSDEKNIIQHPHMEYYTFIKDRFLTNKTFRNKLIEHFSTNNLYVKAPVMRRQGIWFIDLLWK
jgi:hypothetical protein